MDSGGRLRGLEERYKLPELGPGGAPPADFVSFCSFWIVYGECVVLLFSHIS